MKKGNKKIQQPTLFGDEKNPPKPKGNKFKGKKEILTWIHH